VIGGAVSGLQPIISSTNWLTYYLPRRLLFPTSSDITLSCSGETRSVENQQQQQLVATTLADSYVPASSVTAAAAAEAAASKRKSNTLISQPHSHFSIAVETLGLISESAVDYFRELGRRISSKFQEERQSTYLFQRLPVRAAIQCRHFA